MAAEERELARQSRLLNPLVDTGAVAVLPERLSAGQSSSSDGEEGLSSPPSAATSVGAKDSKGNPPKLGEKKQKKDVRPPLIPPVFSLFVSPFPAGYLNGSYFPLPIGFWWFVGAAAPPFLVCRCF